MTPAEIEKLCKWDEPREIQTDFGPRILRTAEPSDEFSKLWKTRKEELKAVGLSWRKDSRSGQWLAVWWSALDDAELKRREETKQKSRQSTSDFNPPAPEGLAYADYQRTGIDFALTAFSRFNGAIIGDEMGLGKTMQAIGCINADPEIKRVLICCPKSLTVNWRNELRKWLVRPMRIHIQRSGDTYFGNHVDILIINYDIVVKYPQLLESQWDMRICDEAHYLKNPKAIRTTATLKTFARRKCHLTGTPIENRPIEIFTLLNDIDPRRWKSRFQFGKRYCNGQNNGWGWDFDGASNSEELQDALRSTIMIRRLKSQVMKELPAKRRQVIEIPSDGLSKLLDREEQDWKVKQAQVDELRVRAELAKANEDFLSYKSAMEKIAKATTVDFDRMAEVRREIGLAKVDSAISFISDAVETGQKLIVFCHHHEVIDALRDKFKDSACVTGRITETEKRQAEVERFQNDPNCRIFFGNLAAAEGLTLTAAEHVIFVEPQWVPGKLAQMEDRAHRYGQKKCVLCSYLVLEGSLDARMLHGCVEKLEIIDKTLDREHDPIEYAVPPVPTKRGESQPVSPRRQKLIQIAEQMTMDQLMEIQRGIQRLADMDADRASEVNGVGFSKIDGRIGHELANSDRMTKMQAALGAVLCNKYRGQIGEGCWTKLAAN